MRQQIADTFANGNIDVIKSFGNVVRIIGHAVDDPGPLGFTQRLPGDSAASFGSPTRFQSNTQTSYFAGDEERYYETINEGIYVDDILIGFNKGATESMSFRNENFRGPVSTDIPDIFANERGTLTNNPLAPADVLELGEYQLEIRRFTEAIAVGQTLDPTFRFTQAATIESIPGADVFDGLTFTLSDGNKEVTFEFDDQDFADGVAAGNIAVTFGAFMNASEVGAQIRDAINRQRVIDVTAGLSDGTVTGGSVGKANKVDLFGNVLVVDVPSPHGLPVTIYDLKGHSNVARDQGQIIIHSNTISNSRSFGVVVEAGLRDLPEYTLFDPRGQVTDAQFNSAAYPPVPGPVRNLGKVNRELLAPGVVVANNVVAFSGEGGIHFGGDPRGFVITAPIIATTPVELAVGDQIRITDNNGKSQVFEFQIQAPVRDTGPLNIIPVQVTVDAAPRDVVALSLLHALEYSDLDIVVHQGKSDELFIEGAQSIVGVNVTFTAFVQEVESGYVPYGRIINNTIVGLGGTYETDALYTPDDFNDVGILVEDNASPTLMNNVLVNLEHGVRTDLTSQDIVQGGQLFQGNIRNAVNVGTGDFVLRIPTSEQLFVDWQQGNFYPAPLSKVIDNAVKSLPDRGDFYVPAKLTSGISESPILSPAYDVLGQLRIDDPRVDPIGGVGETVFVDRGAIDRVDFVGPLASLVVPRDNSARDQDPANDKVRIDRNDLTRFVVRLSDFGDSVSPTGTGIDDGIISGDSVLLLRDGIPLVQDVDYRFDYQATTNELQFTPQAGVWLTGFRYEIHLTNEDQHNIGPIDATGLVDGDLFSITAANANGSTVTRQFEFESGYILSVPQPLTLLVPEGASGLSAVADRDLLTLNNGLKLATFEFDSNGATTPGRIPIRFTPSSTPDQIARAIATATAGAGFGIEPQNLGGGRVHLGGPANLQVDTALSSLVVEGSSGPILDGHVFSIERAGQFTNFEFDRNGQTNNGNIRITFNDNMTQAAIASAVADAIRSSSVGLSPQNIGGGQVHLGGTSDMVVRVNLSSLQVSGRPGTNNPTATAISFVPSAEFDEARTAQIIQAAIQANTATDSYVDPANRVVVRNADTIVGIENVFVPGIRDFAGNALQTNQNEEPFNVVFEIDLPAPLDFGDAPDPTYSTLLGSDGARHVLVPNVHLGTAINDELDGRPSVGADGDTGDDGVTFATSIVRGGRVPITVNASTNGFLDAWVDFNRDGQFDAVTEKVFNSVALTPSFNALRLNVPSTADLGETYARFRFSTIGNLSPTGRAPNGEVEDYRIEIVHVDAPTTTADTYTVAEDNTLSVSAANGVLQNDSDPQGDDLMAILVASPASGVLSLNQDGSFEYVPDENFAGVDSFSYIASDNVQDSLVTTVTIEVEAQPDPPVAGDDSQQLNEDSSTSINLLFNDNDPDGALDRSSVVIVSGPTNGTVEVDANGVATYTPNPNYFGPDSFTYTVSDAEDATSNVATVSIDVLEINDTPVAHNDVLRTRRNVPTVIDLLANDTDIDGQVDGNSIIITFNPKSGGVQLNGDGTVTFTPLLGFIGTDTFRYIVRDNDGATSNEASVTINVGDNNIVPIATNDTATTTPATAITIDVLANDVDQDGTLLPESLTVVQPASNGTAIVQNGRIRYTPSATFVGEDSFRYTVRDNDNDTSNVGVVTVTVNAATKPWQNQENNLDVKPDGIISPIDALLVINELNSPLGSRELLPPPISDRPFMPPPFVDVNGDNFLSPMDALLVINYLNNPTQPAAARGVVATGTQTEIVGAALDIEPRLRLADHTASVDETFDSGDDTQETLTELDTIVQQSSVFQGKQSDSVDNLFAEDLLDDDSDLFGTI
ncbi:MAG: tandem-95 repeat protein [Planctomycetales bacterium]|nr:tandem-95 repeat protein [Planctomycetales bacterium]